MAFTTFRTSGDEVPASYETALITEVRPIVAFKSADQTSASITIASDTELFAALAASTTYKGDL